MKFSWLSRAYYQKNKISFDYISEADLFMLKYKTYLYIIWRYFIMRLKEEEITVLKEKLFLLSNNAKIYLFGSRVDDTKRGGDIDLLIVSDELTKKDIQTLRLEFFKYFDEQKLDIVLDDGKFTNPFTKYIFPKSVQL